MLLSAERRSAFWWDDQQAKGSVRTEAHLFTGRPQLCTGRLATLLSEHLYVSKSLCGDHK